MKPGDTVYRCTFDEMRSSVVAKVGPTTVTLENYNLGGKLLRRGQVFATPREALQGYVASHRADVVVTQQHLRICEEKLAKAERLLAAFDEGKIAARKQGRTDAIAGCADRQRARDDEDYAAGVLSWEA